MLPSFEDREVPKEVAIKVFKTTLMDFKVREKYVHGDHRFSQDDYKKQNPRKIIKMWAMKEVANLKRSVSSQHWENLLQDEELATGIGLFPIPGQGILSWFWFWAVSIKCLVLLPKTYT